MFSLIGIGISIAVAVIAYVQTRDFVRRRLRYVDKVQSPIALWVPVRRSPSSVYRSPPFFPSSVLELVILGTSVGTAVAHGVRDIKRGGSAPSP